MALWKFLLKTIIEGFGVKMAFSSFRLIGITGVCITQQINHITVACELSFKVNFVKIQIVILFIVMLTLKL